MKNNFKDYVCRKCGNIGKVEIYADWKSWEFFWLCRCGAEVREATSEEVLNEVDPKEVKRK